MNLLKNPVIACLVSLAVVLGATGYLVLNEEEKIAPEARGYVEESFFGTWAWLEDDSYEISFSEDGTGNWVGVADTFEWSANEREVFVYVNDILWWTGELLDDRLKMVSTVAEITYYYARLGENITQISRNQEGFIATFHGVTFATRTPLYYAISDAQEFFWLYNSRGDTSSMIQLSVVDAQPTRVDEGALREIANGMGRATGVSNLVESGSIEHEFANKGVTFEMIIDGRSYLGRSYLFIIDDFTVLNITYAHLDDNHSDLLQNFDFIIDNFWVNVNPNDVVQYFTGFLTDHQAEPTDDIFEGMQTEIVELIRSRVEAKRQAYDGEIVVISAPHTATAPRLDSFIPTPTVIYNTLGSENGFMGTHMVVEGEIIEWFSQDGFTNAVIQNELGEIQLAILEPLATNPLSFYQNLLPVGGYFRIYYYYSGFSQLFDRAAGIIIAFTTLDEMEAAGILDEETPQATTEIVTLTGSGATVTDIFFLTAGTHIVSLEHNGPRNFIVRFYNETLERVRGISSLANAIGDFTGQVLIEVPNDGYFAMDIRAGGDWKISFDAAVPTVAPNIESQTFYGTGTSVVFVQAEETQNLVMEFTHTGSRNFIVRFNNRGVINVIGNGEFEGIARIPSAGVFAFEIQADGDWTIAVRE